MRDLEWTVIEAGYEVFDVVSSPSPASHADVQRVPAASDQRTKETWILERERSVTRRYSPSSQAALFRLFADLEATRDGILGFAADYGLLRRARRLDNSSRTGEPIDDWRRELEAIRLAIKLWEAARQADEEALAAHLRWTGSHGIGFQDLRIVAPAINGEDLRLVTSAIEREDLWVRFADGELIGPAFAAVGQLVNERIRTEVAPQMVLTASRNPREKDSPLRLGTAPLTLIGAIWLQLATAISENKHYRRCGYCRTWTEVSRREANAERHYCSTAHRMKAYRERQEEAQGLAASGVAIEEIATKLGSDAETVTNWVKKDTESDRKG